MTLEIKWLIVASMNTYLVHTEQELCCCSILPQTQKAWTTFFQARHSWHWVAVFDGPEPCRYSALARTACNHACKCWHQALPGFSTTSTHALSQNVARHSREQPSPHHTLDDAHVLQREARERSWSKLNSRKNGAASQAV